MLSLNYTPKKDNLLTYTPRRTAMKTKKKMTIAGSILLSTLFIVGAGFVAQEGPGFYQGGFHHRFHGRGFSKHILKRLDSRVEKLNLTDLQQKKYQEMRGRVEQEILGMKNNRGKFFQEIREEMNQETPDVEKIAGLMKGKLEQMPVKIGAHLDQFVEFYNVLDEEQRAQIIQKFRDKMDRHPLHRHHNDTDEESEDR